MKKEYNKPIIEIEQLEIEDIITTSSNSAKFDSKNIFDLNATDDWYNE